MWWLTWHIQTSKEREYEPRSLKIKIKFRKFEEKKKSEGEKLREERRWPGQPPPVTVYTTTAAQPQQPLPEVTQPNQGITWPNLMRLSLEEQIVFQVFEILSCNEIMRVT